MLRNLSIKNLALIKETEIEFGSGLNVLLGETGSGKSLLFDSVAFVLGQKSDKSLIRKGESSMRVEALFTDLSPATKQLMKELDLEEDEELLIVRTMQEDGRSSFKINGQMATASIVKKLAKSLLDTLVQHESLELLKTKNHLSMLDAFGGDEVQSLLQSVSCHYLQKREIEKRIASLGGSEEERARACELLSYQLDEIDKAELQIGEDDEIKEKLDFMTNSERIFEVSSTCESILSTDTYSALGQINSAISQLNSLSKFEQFDALRERLISLRYDLEDISESLSDLKESTTFDEVEFNRLDSRSDLIKSLKKKYGKTIEEVLNYSEEIRNKLNELTSSEETVLKLKKELEKIERDLLQACKLLSSKRKTVALEIEARVISELKDLGMKATSFEVKFTDKSASADGCDDVEFVFSANKGQDMKNLAKTASGGETSRIMLALKNIFASSDGVGTLMFDEVDSGISGEVGNMVAQKLESISRMAQILCITHLPQVASLADHFFLVKKYIEGNSTISSTQEIEEGQAIEEIARLISGDNLSEIALKHANELRGRKHSAV